MASVLASRPSFHARSNSLPSRPHPISEQIDQQLCRLRSSQADSTTAASHTSNLNGLKDLYASVDELLQLPLHKQTLSQNRQTRLVEVLDGSLRLLDICATSRDILSQSKESLQDIQSVLRRRCSGELSIANEAAEYLNTRKKAKKACNKALKTMKAANKSVETETMIGMLSNVEEISVDTFSSLLSYIAASNLRQSQRSTWSVVAKLIHQSSDKATAEGPTSEFEAVDAALDSITGQKKKTGISASQLESLRKQMAQLETVIRDIDEKMECLFRHLVKTRATLLNILSN